MWPSWSWRILIPPPAQQSFPTLQWNSEPATHRRDTLIHLADTPDCCHQLRQYVYEELEELEKLDAARSVSAAWQTKRIVRLFRRSRFGQSDSNVMKRPNSLIGFEEGDSLDVMAHSVLCPVLPGDHTFRVRLYQAILVGCIPVFPTFSAQYASNSTSFFRDNGVPWEDALPFIDRIDWQRAAIFVPRESGMPDYSYAHEFVEAMTRIKLVEIRDRQHYLDATVRQWITYDFQGSRPDAFTAALDALVAVRKRNSEEVSVGCYDIDDDINHEGIYGRVGCCIEPVREGHLVRIRSA